MGVVKKMKRGREAIEAPLWGRVLGRRRAYGPLVVSVWAISEVTRVFRHEQ